MPANRLTANEVKNAKPDTERNVIRRIADGKGLWLEVRPSGSRYWRYRFKIGAQELTYTIGEAGYGRGEVTLEEARNERARLREMVKAGKNPTTERNKAKSQVIREGKNTFRAIAQDWIADNEPHWSARYKTLIEAAMQDAIYPKIGDTPIKDVTAGAVRDLLSPLRKGKAVTAQNYLLWIGGACRYAVAHDLMEGDPTRDLRGFIKRPEVSHHKPVSLEQMPGILAKIRADKGQPQIRIGLEILAHTFVRPNELAGAEWKEVDFDNALWIVPAERTKMRDVHYVPLSSQVIELLRQLQKVTGHSRWLFPNIWGKDKPMPPTNFNRLIDRMGLGETLSPHAFRATASTKLNELNYNADWIERQLGHAERNKVRASYNQARHLPERRKMMQHYSDLITNPSAGNVIPLRREQEAAA